MDAKSKRSNLEEIHYIQVLMYLILLQSSLDFDLNIKFSCFGHGIFDTFKSTEIKKWTPKDFFFRVGSLKGQLPTASRLATTICLQIKRQVILEIPRMMVQDADYGHKNRGKKESLPVVFKSI